MFPIPWQVDGTPVLCISASAASSDVRVSFVFSDVCFYLHDCCYIFPFISAFSRVSCVVLAPPAGHRNTCLEFRALCRCSLVLYQVFLVLLFFYSVAFRLVLPYRPSVGPLPRHIIGLIVPANSNRVPVGLGLRPARMHKDFCFGFLSIHFFPFFSFLFFHRPFLPFCTLFCITFLSSPLFRVYACTTAMVLVLSRSK